MSEKGTLERVFESLDAWRHLPAYQLERRTDVLFLPEVLKKHFGTSINPKIIPEFPIKNESNNQSNNVDFFALSKDRKVAFLVELKTDMAHRRAEQDHVMDYAVGRGLEQLIRDIKVICHASQKKPKYVHLLHGLKSLDLVCYGEEDEDALYKKALARDYDIFNKARPTSWVSGGTPELKSIYIQPECPAPLWTSRRSRALSKKGKETRISGGYLPVISGSGLALGPAHPIHYAHGCDPAPPLQVHLPSGRPMPSAPVAPVPRRRSGRPSTRPRSSPSTPAMK